MVPALFTAADQITKFHGKSLFPALLIPQPLQFLHCPDHYCVSLVVWTLQLDTG